MFGSHKTKKSFSSSWNDSIVLYYAHRPDQYHKNQAKQNINKHSLSIDLHKKFSTVITWYL